METNENLNWANDFGISENIGEFSANLLGLYSRIASKYKAHPLNNEWRNKAMDWAKYSNNIPNLNFPSEEAANLEVERLVKLLKEAEELERDLKLTKAA